MIPKKILVVWLTLAAVFAGITCAPQDDPAAKSSSIETDDGRSKPRVELPATHKERVQMALKNIHDREVHPSYSFWTVFHAILGMGLDTKLIDPETKKPVNAVEYICQYREMPGLFFLPMKQGVDVKSEPGDGRFQGHQDQFIAEMAQWGMPKDQKFLINDQEHTFAEFIKYAKMRASVKKKQELSWAILIISQYYGTDIRWTNKYKEKLTFEDVVRYELNEPIDGAACGGTHRLFGLTWAYHLHLNHGGKKTGVWNDVADKIEQYKKFARQYKNADGAFSTNYVSSPGNAKDVQQRIGSTGHVLEWLALALTDDELKEAWVQDAADVLVEMIVNSDHTDSGSLYHAAHGLHIYHDRLFGRYRPHGPLIPRPPKK